jgi:hypothetical protein
VLGIVFGDMGTSPLHAFEESIRAAGGAGEANVLGVLSLVIWFLILVVSIKYLLLVSRADNEGEGGILALLALLERDSHRPKISVGPSVMLILFGAALLFGDGMIRPTIWVLSAVEGLTVTFPGLHLGSFPLRWGSFSDSFLSGGHHVVRGDWWSWVVRHCANSVSSGGDSSVACDCLRDGRWVVNGLYVGGGGSGGDGSGGQMRFHPQSASYVFNCEMN